MAGFEIDERKLRQGAERLPHQRTDLDDLRDLKYSAWFIGSALLFLFSVGLLVWAVYGMFRG